jgi:uncharacterized membrane protein YbhN (UPF0104 family)
MSGPERADRPRLRRGAVLALRLGVVLGALVFLLRGRAIAWGDVGATLREADVGLLLAVVALNGIMMAVKSARLGILLEGRPSFRTCFLAKLTASAINNVAPLRGGDVARVWMLERQAGITKTAAAAVALVETLLELGALSTIVVVAAAAGEVPGQRWASGVAPILLGIALGCLMLLGWLGRAGEGGPASGARSLRARVRALRAKIEPGVRALGRPRTLAASIGLSLGAWAIEAAMVLLTARAVHLPVSVPLAALVLLGINVALVLPSLPAGVGAFEAAVALVLTLAGIAKGPAIAFALLYHVIQVIPVTIAGAWVVFRVGITLSGLPAAGG